MKEKSNLTFLKVVPLHVTTLRHRPLDMKGEAVGAKDGLLRSPQ